MSEVLRNKQLGAAQTWQPPHVGRHDQQKKSTADAAANLEQAYAEAYERGHAQGFAAAQLETGLIQSQLKCIVSALQDPLDAADEQVLEKISALAIAIAKRLVRRELRTDRAEVVGVVREALAVLPLDLPDIRLHLHPDDAQLVSDTLTPTKGDAAWHIVEDPVISRGGCRISSSTSQVDATVETRLENVINSMLGDDRAEDAGHAE